MRRVGGEGGAGGGGIPVSAPVRAQMPLFSCETMGESFHPDIFFTPFRTRDPLGLQANFRECRQREDWPVLGTSHMQHQEAGFCFRICCASLRSYRTFLLHPSIFESGIVGFQPNLRWPEFPGERCWNYLECNG